MDSAMEAHDRAVARIAEDVKEFYARKEPFRIYHGSTNTTRKSQFEREQVIDTSGLDHILQFDAVNKTVLVEPNVPMDALVEATLKHGFLPPVVMEFPGITVGGGFAGTAGESSSFRWGFFDRTINRIEMVLPDGQVLMASKAENADLFFGAASSFGTLGITTLLKIQLVEAKSHVRLTYYPVESVAHAQKAIDVATEDDTITYLDAIMFSSTFGVVCIGRLTDDVGGAKIQGFTKRSDPWFYLHVKQLMTNRIMPTEEAIPIVDYLFRYDRGAFWIAVYSFSYFMTPFNRITRWILDYYMHTRVMYLALHKSGLSSQYIIQDVAIPYSRAPEFMQYLETEFNQHPIWLCPLKQNGKGTHTLQLKKTNRETPERMLNFGVWGPGPKAKDAFVAWNRKLELKVDELGGQKWLYAHTYYTEQEFDDIYNRKEYEGLREKYNASYLPTVYDKVKVDFAKEEKAIKESWVAWLSMLFWSIWPLAGLYGVYKAFRGGDYLLPKAKKKCFKKVCFDVPKEE
ncbi:Delta(24)-sterol reductase [Lachnellula suecica]|uniref:Delta(24)-sterol reductase n=1 Tax=Lachnellula suecica TaxID=602035 RepID=A0A8T9C330_9HELO|nr:Delta(24)-sterol reductase [Lachnellula suecica]